MFQQPEGYGDSAAAAGLTRSDQPLKQASRETCCALPCAGLTEIRRKSSSPEKSVIAPAGSATSPADERHTVWILAWYDDRVDHSSNGSPRAITFSPRSVQTRCR